MDLKVVLGSSLTMCDHHISSVCRSAYLELRGIGSIRPFLNVQQAAGLALSRILSKIDYCNSLLAGITSEQIDWHQKIQNHAARLTFRKKRHDQVTPLLKKLHRLPVSERIVFRLATLSFRYFDGTLPPYLSCCLSSYSSSRSLRSSSQTSERPKGQPEKCWCTIYSIPGSTRLEFTTFEIPPLLVFVFF